MNAVGGGLKRCARSDWFGTLDCYFSGDTEALDALLFNAIVIVSVLVTTALALAALVHPHAHR